MIRIFFVLGLVFTLALDAAAQESFSGEARLVAIADTKIASESPGIVRAIQVTPGQQVGQESELIRLNDELFQAEYDVAAAEYEIAKLESKNRVKIDYANKSAEVAAAVLEKSVQANKIYARSIPATEIEKLRLEFEQSKLSGEQASMELEMAQWSAQLQKRKANASQVRLDSRSVRAPYSGRIAQVFVQPGQWVNAGEPVARLIDSSRLRAEAYLHEDLIRQVRVGQEASFEYRLAGETTTVPAKITFVGIEVVEGIFQVWAEFENAEGVHLPGTEGQLIISSLKDE